MRHFAFSGTRLWLFALIVSMAALSAGCGALWGCDDVQQVVAKVRGLDQTYLAQLHAFVASGQCKHSCRPPLLDRLRGFGNRAPLLEITPRNAQVKLSVCMDEGVILLIRDANTPRASIVVIWSHDDIRWDEAQLWAANGAG